MVEIDNSLINVDLEKCTLCKACVNDCITGVFYVESDKLNIVDGFEDLCILCGHCVAICPVNVIKLKINEESFTREIENTDEYPNFQSLSNLVLKRRSIRKFKDTPVPKAVLEEILDLARFSPTASNTENVHYTIIQDKKIVKTISDYITTKVKRFVQNLDDPKGRKIMKAHMPKEEFDLAIENLPRTKAILSSIDKGTDFWCWDGEIIFIHGEITIGGIITNSSLAAAHIMLAAESLGLGTCSLGYLTFHTNQSETIKKIINLPENHEVGYSLVIGYPKVKYRRIPSRKPLRAQWF